MKININEARAMFERTSFYARKYVSQNVDELKRNYGLKYLAIALDEGVVDSDENKFNLIKRLQDKGDERSVILDTIENLLRAKVVNN